MRYAYFLLCLSFLPLPAWAETPLPSPASSPAPSPSIDAASGEGEETPKSPSDALQNEAADAPKLRLALYKLDDKGDASELLLSSDASPTDAAELRLSEPVLLKIEVLGSKDQEVFLPYKPLLGNFQIVGIEDGQGNAKEANAEQAAPEEAPLGDDTVSSSRSWKILPLRLGAERIPPLEIPYRLSNGKEGLIKTPVLRSFVRGFLENENDPSLGQAPSPLSIMTTNWLLVWLLSLLAALGLAFLMGWVVVLALRHRFLALLPPPPKRPANEVALQRLEELEALSDEAMPPEEREETTIHILRQYLGGRYDMDALGMTTDELEAQLNGNIDLRGIPAHEIIGMLELSDLSKFARRALGGEDARKASERVKVIVETTWVEEEKEEAHERIEKASLKQRLYAGLLDLMMASLLGAILFLALLLSGEGQWAFLSLLLIGFLLSIRDLFGPSPGKRLLRTRVVTNTPTQSLPTVKQAFLRNILLFLWPIFLPIEWLIISHHPLSLRLGDMWTHTEVVRDDLRKEAP